MKHIGFYLICEFLNFWCKTPSFDFRCSPGLQDGIYERKVGKK